MSEEPMTERQLSDDGVITTLNRRGHTSTQLNEFSQRFVESLVDVRAPVVDIGCAFGVCTLPALATGATVVACDIERRHLAGLVANCPEIDRPRLVPLIVDFPNGPHFAAGSIAAVHAANLLNYLPGPDLVRAAELMFGMLQPGGQVFTVSGTPYAANVREFIPVYEDNKLRGVEWPGELHDLHSLCTDPTTRDLPNFLHLLDDEVLRRTFTAAGFVVTEARMYERANISAYLKWDGRENVGLIARKPAGRSGGDD
jgi:SAM-dependent methyltransferase